MTKAITQHHRLDHAPFLVKPGARVRVKELDAGYTAGFKDKDEAHEALLEDVSVLSAAQELLWASGKHAVLIVFQAMDAAGKDGTIKHVMSGVNPQGCDVHGFKAPSDEERQHHFLWRPVRFLPARGRISIFNRSYYEEVLVVRVHPELLERQWLLHDSRDGADSKIWKSRFEQINAFERTIVTGGTCILKFFLNVSREAQRKRFVDRLTDKEKQWKFSPADYQERAHWDAYMRAYEKMLSATSTEWAPWYVIPADHKWFMRACVADIIASTIHAMDLRYPEVDEKKLAELGEILQALKTKENDA